MREPTELRVDPVALAPARRDGSRRALLVVGLAVAFVGAALAKPWEGPGLGPAEVAEAAEGRPTPVATPGATVAGPTATPKATPAVPATPLPFIVSDADLAAIAVPPRAWGVRAIVVPAGHVPGDPPLIERWTPLGRDPRDGDGPHLAAAQLGDVVLAVGLTTPIEVLPLDVRASRIRTGDLPRRVLPRLVAGSDPLAPLWAPNEGEATMHASWPAAVYRLDVLLGPEIVAVSFVVPSAAPPRPRDVVITSLAGPPDLAAALAGVPSGAISVTGPEVSSLGIVATDALDLRGAWLAPGGTAPGVPRQVGRIASRATRGIGVVFASDVAPAEAWLTRVDTGERRVRTVVRTVALPNADGRPARTAVILQPDGPGSFNTGLYRLSIRLAGRTEPTHWHTEVVPPAGEPVRDPVIEAVTTWTALTTSTAADEDLAAAWAWPLVTVANRTTGGVADGCAGARILGDRPFFGIVHEVGATVRAITLERVSGRGTPRQVRVPVALHAAPRLSLVGVPASGWNDGEYDVTVERQTNAGRTLTTYRVCAR